MTNPLYVVDAFASGPFTGNPAAVMPLPGWLDDALMQAVAAQNNLAETAFLVPAGDDWELRWFTPAVEVPLCGHATLASAHVLFTHLGLAAPAVTFHTRSGRLRVAREGAALTLDFPPYALREVPADAAVTAALGASPREFLWVEGADKQLCVFDSQAEVAALSPDFPALLAATPRCVVATAPGDDCDFVSRFFGPQVGIDEDPVTGSAHCALVPYWAKRLGRDDLQARQISARGGNIDCVLRDGRVFLTGTARTYLCGEVDLAAEA
ncbi:PhzF family phenazine biosynthesis protein [Mangrovimicrobium sediminis]|uniref:PhzF family phenazine biosynthesis protein n=1 Tax=Mangrovimicrobium sediminis TaxID=2562682 RepID=A0A4Z0M793_9GAMM|nr:PhzF family phenazine biosynthesis protein [Haliea sp. SAOS-164]TGD75185.1 PhzF family phenazine biosynthesis protein [Haliea sp. SAOS-164]